MWKALLGLNDGLQKREELFQTKPMIAKFFNHSEDPDDLNYSTKTYSSEKNYSRIKRRTFQSPSSEEGDSVLSNHSFSNPRIPGPIPFVNKDTFFNNTQRGSNPIDTLPYPSEEVFQFYFSQEEGENRSKMSTSTFLSGEGHQSPKESIGAVSGFEDRSEQRMLIREDKKRCRFTSVSKSRPYLYT